MTIIDSRDSERGYSTTSALASEPNQPCRRVESASRRGSRDPDSCNEEPARRNSAFFEVGLGGEDAIIDAKLRQESRPKLQVRFSSDINVVEPEAIETSEPSPADHLPRPQMSSYFPTLPRLLFLALAIALVAPSLHSSPQWIAEANPLGRRARSPTTSESLQGVKRDELPAISKSEDSQTDVCKRWAGQSAVVNGTLYYYGGRATTSSDQTTDTWSMWRHS